MGWAVSHLEWYHRGKGYYEWDGHHIWDGTTIGKDTTMERILWIRWVPHLGWYHSWHDTIVEKGSTAERSIVTGMGTTAGLITAIIKYEYINKDG